jgi:hypothetical protein
VHITTQNLEKEAIMFLTSLEHQPIELLPSDLLRPLGAFEELFCLFDQRSPTYHALAAQITGHTTVQRGATRLTQYSNATHCSPPV